MNDNALRGPQWQRLVGEYLASRLGGTKSAWAEANQIVTDKQYADHLASLEKGTTHDADYLDYLADDDRRWLRGMCELVGVSAPDGDDECIRLARDTAAHVIPRVRSAIPGAVDAIRSLHTAGYTLQTASGESSEDLEGYLTGMGVRPLFGRLYGPDLVNTWKEGTLYYERIFADAGVAPSHALVVDDKVICVEWAIEAGAAAVQVAAGSPAPPGDYTVLSGLNELPTLLNRL